MIRARALIEGIVATLGALAFAAIAIGLWIVFDPAPDQRPPAAARALRIIHAARRCPAPDAAPGPSRDAIASLLAQLEEGRP